MPSLTIGGQVRAITYTATQLKQAELQIHKIGGRAIGEVLGFHHGQFLQVELEWLLWQAWQSQLLTERTTVPALMEQFYAEGGTVYDIQSEVIEAIIEAGPYGHRNGSRPAPPGDPSAARASA